MKKPSKAAKSSKPIPNSKAAWAAWTCQTTCDMAASVIERTSRTPVGYSEMEYAMYLLCRAVEQLSIQLSHISKP